MRSATYIAAVLLCLVTGSVLATADAEFQELEQTLLHIVEGLEAEGVLSAADASAIRQQGNPAPPEHPASYVPEAIREELKALVRAELNQEAEKVATAAETLARVEQEGLGSPGGKVVRVPYVPEFVKEDIRNQVRAELRSEVVEDVLQQAKNERWGLPDALPGWVNGIKFKGDVRLRAQSDLFAGKNITNSYPDFPAINDAGGVGPAGLDAFSNTTQDRYRGRARVRMQMDASVDTSLKASMRLTTGNLGDPVSTNQTLGESFNRYGVVLDRAFVRWNGVNLDDYPYLTVSGGRIPNPWLSSDLLWDSDLGFEGVALTYRHNLRGSDNLLDLTERDRTLFATVGVFPLEELELSSEDKWLFGAQLGTELIFDDQSQFSAGIAYYHYENIVGKRNSVGSSVLDFTAPEVVQKGNTLFDISDPSNPNSQRFALVADYRLVNLHAAYDFAQLAPLHFVVTADVVKNIGFDKDDVERRAGVRVDDEVLGYQLGFTAGWPRVTKRRDWQVFGAYRYLERDAVLDAYTDSDFHLGGTDAKGWMLGGSYGLLDNTWVTLRWLSSDEIDGPPLGIDTIQVDLNTSF